MEELRLSEPASSVPVPSSNPLIQSASSSTSALRNVPVPTTSADTTPAAFGLHQITHVSRSVSFAGVDEDDRDDDYLYDPDFDELCSQVPDHILRGEEDSSSEPEGKGKGRAE